MQYAAAEPAVDTPNAAEQLPAQPLQHQEAADFVEDQAEPSQQQQQVYQQQRAAPHQAQPQHHYAPPEAEQQVNVVL